MVQPKSVARWGAELIVAFVLGMTTTAFLPDLGGPGPAARGRPYDGADRAQGMPSDATELGAPQRSGKLSDAAYSEATRGLLRSIRPADADGDAAPTTARGNGGCAPWCYCYVSTVAVWVMCG